MITMSLSQAALATGGTLHGVDNHFTGCGTDSRSIQQGELFIALKGEHYDGHDYFDSVVEQGASAALVEKQLPGDLPQIVVKNTRKSMGLLAGYWRNEFQLPVIALTGSNGKTSVKEMLVNILSQKSQVLATKGNLNNDIGVPLTLFGLGKEHQYAVVEMGANHIGEIDYLARMVCPTVALITQCAPAHLQGFGSVEAIAKAKAEIFNGLNNDGIAIINADDHFFEFWHGKTLPYKQITFGFNNQADVTAKDVVMDGNTVGNQFLLQSNNNSIQVNLPLPGKHNVMNALAATACSLAIGISLVDIKNGLERMQAVKGRMQLKITPCGARVFDDTYNANPTSLKAGLDVLEATSGTRWLVLGDMGELGDATTDFHFQAGESARDHSVERLYTIGKFSKHAVAGFGNGARHFDDAEKLIAVLRSELKQDVTVLVKGSRAMAMDHVVDQLMVEG